jgi:hypothetical protein
MEDFFVYYIEEEIQDECLQMAQNDILSKGLSPLTVSEYEPGSTGTGAKSRVEERSVTIRHQEGAKDGTWDASNEAEDGRMSKEGGEVLVPPPISTPSDQWPVPLLFFHPKQLDLVLDLRRQMANHAYRGTLMSQCIDMLYEAFSNTPTKKRCPMCVRLYALPTRNEVPSEDPDNEDLNG